MAMDLLQDKRPWDRGFTSLRRWKEYWKRVKKGKQIAEHDISADEAMIAIGACCQEVGCVPLQIWGYDAAKELFDLQMMNGNKKVFDAKLRDFVVVQTVIVMRGKVGQPIDKQAKRPSELYNTTIHPAPRIIL